MNFDELSNAAAAIRSKTGRIHHSVAAVLGSGLGAYAADLPAAAELPYEDIPAFPVPEVEGHAGSLFSSELEGVATLLFSGRVHAYEGWELDDVVFGVRTAVMCGCSTVLLTNAAGGVTIDFSPGDLVAITDHLNLTGRNPLAGPNDDRLGPRFPDMTDLYDRELRATCLAVGEEVGISLRQGVYAWLNGPSYETPAEIRMARTLGADLVGMSTVPEAIAVRHMGAKVAAISLVTNHAAGVVDKPLSHDEVKEAGEAAQEPFGRLLDALLPRLAAPG